MAVAETRWNVDASELRAKAERCRRLAARTTDRKSADAMRSLADLCEAAFADMVAQPGEDPPRQRPYGSTLFSGSLLTYA
jgi:hypothetical protein